MSSILLDKGIILSSGEISKDKINLVAGAITQPFAEMVWVTTGGDMETINRLTDILVSMNTPADRGKLFKIIKMLYGLMGLQFSEEAEPMDADPAVLEYFIFSFTADFGEIIKELINCLIIGCDEKGLHFVFNLSGNKTVDDLGLSANGTAIIKGAQGATGTATIATFTAGFILVMITLIVVLNLTRSRAGRAIMAIRDNRIAAQAIGLNLTKYKLMAFVTSAALAGAAGALFGLNYSSLQATKFNFNLSILVLVFVVLGGLGNIWGSLVAAAALTILPAPRLPYAHLRDRADLRHARDQQSAGQGVLPETSAPSPRQC